MGVRPDPITGGLNVIKYCLIFIFSCSVIYSTENFIGNDACYAWFSSRVGWMNYFEQAKDQYICLPKDRQTPKDKSGYCSSICDLLCPSDSPPISLFYEVTSECNKQCNAEGIIEYDPKNYDIFCSEK